MSKRINPNNKKNSKSNLAKDLKIQANVNFKDKTLNLTQTNYEDLQGKYFIGSRSKGVQFQRIEQKKAGKLTESFGQKLYKDFKQNKTKTSFDIYGQPNNKNDDISTQQIFEEEPKDEIIEEPMEDISNTNMELELSKEEKMLQSEIIEQKWPKRTFEDYRNDMKQNLEPKNIDIIPIKIERRKSDSESEGNIELDNINKVREETGLKPFNTIYCWVCLQVNKHSTANCPYNHCKICNNMGHIANNCIRKPRICQFCNEDLNKINNPKAKHDNWLDCPNRKYIIGAKCLYCKGYGHILKNCPALK